MKKRLSVILALVMILSVLAACGKSGGDSTPSGSSSPSGGQTAADPAPTDSAKNIALVIKNETDPFWIDYINGLKDACDSFGFKYTLFSNQKETDVEDQQELLRTVLSQQFDLIVAAPLDSTAIAPFVLECNNAGTPLFIVDTAADKEACSQLGAKVDYFVTGEDFLGGKIAAQMLVDALDGAGNIAILEGMSGSSTAAAIQDGHMEIFNQHPDIKILVSDTANWARSEGYDKTTNFLAAYPDLDGIIAANDEMAQGAIQAIEAAGKTGDITVVTLNYTQDCIDTMESGQLYGTVDKGPYRQGYQAITRANDLFNGVDIPEEETVPPLAYLYTDPLNPSDSYPVENFK